MLSKKSKKRIWLPAEKFPSKLRLFIFLCIFTLATENYLQRKNAKFPLFIPMFLHMRSAFFVWRYTKGSSKWFCFSFHQDGHTSHSGRNSHRRVRKWKQSLAERNTTKLLEEWKTTRNGVHLSNQQSKIKKTTRKQLTLVSFICFLVVFSTCKAFVVIYRWSGKRRSSW